jgi:hypothetical protein
MTCDLLSQCIGMSLDGMLFPQVIEHLLLELTYLSVELLFVFDPVLLIKPTLIYFVLLVFDLLNLVFHLGSKFNN